MSGMLLYLFIRNFLLNLNKINLKPPGVSNQQSHHMLRKGKTLLVNQKRGLGRGRDAKSGRVKVLALYEMTPLLVSSKFSKINTQNVIGSNSF